MYNMLICYYISITAEQNTWTKSFNLVRSCIWEKIIPGKIDRFISDNTTLDQEMCLLDQDFIKDEQQSVAEYIKTYGDAEVSSFKRVSLG